MSNVSDNHNIIDLLIIRVLKFKSHSENYEDAPLQIGSLELPLELKYTYF